MIQETKQDFIVIDDDPINNMICSKIIGLTVPGTDIRTFTSPEKGVDHMRALHPAGQSAFTVLFLDINMPSLSGWDVLDKVNDLNETIKSTLKIYMLSSSVDHQDREKADKHPLVMGYISKPLTRSKLLSFLNGEAVA